MNGIQNISKKIIIWDNPNMSGIYIPFFFNKKIINYKTAEKHKLYDLGLTEEKSEKSRLYIILTVTHIYRIEIHIYETSSQNQAVFKYVQPTQRQTHFVYVVIKS